MDSDSQAPREHKNPVVRGDKQMSRKGSMILSVLVLSLVVVVPAFAQGPSFEPVIYADGAAWSTKGLGALPAPNEAMMGSFDTLYLFENGAEGQLPVSEAGPGNPAYNGGRWAAQGVTWTTASPPVVKDAASILFYLGTGDLILTPGFVPSYFECPLLPVK
jgi:hypothetical protein